MTILAVALGCGGGSKVGSGSSSGDAGSGAMAGTSSAAGEAGTEAQGAASGSAGNGGAGVSGGGGPSAGSGGAGEGLASGAGGSAGAIGEAGGEAGAAVTVPAVTGNWAMFFFEDPVAVQLEQREGLLDGFGCCAGLDATLASCCGSLSGSLSGNHAAFAFDAGSSAYVYSTDVTVSADGQRMGGTFGVNGPGDLNVAWVRIDGTYLGSPPEALLETLNSRVGEYELRLDSDFGDRFDRFDSFAIRILAHGFIMSSLGPFYWNEMSWNPDTQVLTAGPVPATAPSFATELELEFTGYVLTRVSAHYPDEPTYFFDAGPPR
jgi:hypothetical protein